jgi:hypothetical protein
MARITMETRFSPTSFLKIFLLCLALLFGVSGAKAQVGRNIEISIPDSAEYPLLTVYIDPTDSNGNPLEALERDQITLVEDGLNRDLLDIQALNPGIQLVLAFNFSTPFAIQDINGRSRFDYIQESLLNWAAQPLDTAADDLSIVDNIDIDQVHVEQKSDWITTLEDLDPALRETESNLNVLARAIEIASDPVSQPGMKKIVLFFSPQPEPDGFATIDSLTAQAKDNQVRVYSVLVSSPAFFENAGAARLQNLSAETGGTFLTFSGEEPFPDLGQLLLPLRTTYMLQYQSSIVTSGTHTLEIIIAATPATIDGSREFQLDIQPPNPIFITPPRSITRTALEDGQDDIDQINYDPEILTLPILVEFPDLHPRPIEELIFRVDGEIVEIKTAPPYDQFIWDLDKYQVSGTHYLTLEAVDIMGLSRLSIETPIEIEVIPPTQDIWDIARKNTPVMLGLAFILILGLTLFVLISQGRIRPGKNPVSRWLREQRVKAIKFLKGKFQFKTGSVAPAETETRPYRLIPANDITSQLFPEPIQIDQPEIVLGTANRENVIKIQHPSIIAEHTRISALRGDQFQVTDLGSTAGTWINYQQISPSATHSLKDGDIINIGEAAFRFQIKTGANSLAENKE